MQQYSKLRRALNSLVLSIKAHPDYTGQPNEEWTDLVELAMDALITTPPSEAEGQAIQAPVGQFIIDQKDVKPDIREDGAYYYYGDVCVLLNRYKASHPAPEQVDPKLIDVYKEYTQLLADECSELVGMAAVHGWKSTRHEKGIELRAKIEHLQNKQP